MNIDSFKSREDRRAMSYRDSVKMMRLVRSWYGNWIHTYSRVQKLLLPVFLVVLQMNKGWAISLGPSQKNCSFSFIANPKKVKLWYIAPTIMMNIILNFHVPISTNKGDIWINILNNFFFHVKKATNDNFIHK
jgi:hypothetical protein